MAISTLDSTSATSQLLATSTTSSKANANANTDAQAAQDRFLTLLVAQLNNQDPMSPMDNAQMTSQMAQINTVTGIQQVNQTLKSMADQFASMQVMQGAALVGHQVIVDGHTVQVSSGHAQAAMDLAANADSVKVEVLTPGGQVLDTLQLGPQVQGRVPFQWDSSAYAERNDLSIRITASSGGKAVAATAQTVATVQSVSTGASGMALQLDNSAKPVAYTSIRAIL